MKQRRIINLTLWVCTTKQITNAQTSKHQKLPREIAHLNPSISTELLPNKERTRQHSPINRQDTELIASASAAAKECPRPEPPATLFRF